MVVTCLAENISEQPAVPSKSLNNFFNKFTSTIFFLDSSSPPEPEEPEEPEEYKEPVCQNDTLGTDSDGPFEKHDTAKRWLVVDQRFPFERDGIVSKVQLTAGSDSDAKWSDNRKMKVYMFL